MFVYDERLLYVFVVRIEVLDLKEVDEELNCGRMGGGRQ